eukprot:scaffold9731_cov113-Isochrysis_galbana.AAC.2
MSNLSRPVLTRKDTEKREAKHCRAAWMTTSRQRNRTQLPRVELPKGERRRRVGVGGEARKGERERLSLYLARCYNSVRRNTTRTPIRSYIRSR